MDKRLEAKVCAAMNEAFEEAKRRGLWTIPDVMQFAADYLINHHDPEIVAFQERHNRQVRRDLN